MARSILADLLKGNVANRNLRASFFSLLYAQRRFSVSNPHTELLAQLRRNEGQADAFLRRGNPFHDRLTGKFIVNDHFLSDRYRASIFSVFAKLSYLEFFEMEFRAMGYSIVEKILANRII